MSGISSNYYLDYSSLFASGSSSQSSSSNLYNLQQTSSSASYSNYGVNNSNLTTAQAGSILDLKNAATTIQQSLSSLLTKKNDGSSVFGSYKATSSNSEALSATFNNNINKYSSEALLARRDPNYKPSAPEELSVKTVQLAQTQKNTGEVLSKSGMELETGKTYRFEISDGDKATTISFVTEKGDTNESVMKKIASAINDKNIGVKANVNTNDANGTSSLVLESRETGLKKGQDSAFEIKDISGYDAVEKLGLNNTTQEALNAKYYVKTKNGSEELLESKTNDVQLTDRTSATLKKTTEDYVKIGYEKDSLDGINSVRNVVNGFNALFDAAASGSTVQSARLAQQLQGLADTYAKALADVGITRNGDGYFEINEDKMKKAAESGALENLFSSDDKATNYGFAKRLETIANTVADNPNQYVVGKSLSSNEDGSSKFSNFMEELNSASNPSYSKLYFNLQRYENMGALFNSMF